MRNFLEVNTFEINQNALNTKRENFQNIKNGQTIKINNKFLPKKLQLFYIFWTNVSK